MKLYEFEGKNLLRSVGISVPKSVLISKDTGLASVSLDFPWIVKPQLLSGKRKKRGLIKEVNDIKDAETVVGKLFLNKKEGVSKILIEEKIKAVREIYLALTYSTRTRTPVLLYSLSGGTGIERHKPKMIPLNILDSGSDSEPEINDKLRSVVNVLYKELFLKKDLFLLEINPLALTEGGEFVALDAKIITDDAAHFRQDGDFSSRNILGREKTNDEREAEQIDQLDHHGVCGRVYLKLDGDIAILASGGGASLVAMDSLISYGGRPANYTEYSGNPPSYKVKRLTKIALSKPNLKGCYVVGAKANFTDIYETLKGFLDGLKEVKPRPKYPIVIRRDGPRCKEAFDMLEKVSKKEGWKFFLFDSKTPIIEASRKMAELVNQNA